MSESTLERVMDIIIETIGLNNDTPLTKDTGLIGDGISLDSAAILEILVRMELEWGIEINPHELFDEQALKTIGSLSDFIDARLCRR